MGQGPLEASWSRKPVHAAQRGSKGSRVGLLSRVALAGLLSVYFSGAALGNDDDDSDDEPAKPASTLPNIYLDLRTIYTTVPANALSIGFSNPSLPTALTTLTNLTTLSTLSSPSSQSIAVDVPLTVDLNDRVSVYGGFSGSASKTGTSNWSAFTISSWNPGFQADVYQQDGGWFPTITLQPTLTRSVPDSPLATTSLNTIPGV
jgi:hypothetical protein